MQLIDGDKWLLRFPSRCRVESLLIKLDESQRSETTFMSFAHLELHRRILQSLEMSSAYVKKLWTTNNKKCPWNMLHLLTMFASEFSSKGFMSFGGWRNFYIWGFIDFAIGALLNGKYLFILGLEFKADHKSSLFDLQHDENTQVTEPTSKANQQISRKCGIKFDTFASREH